MTIVAFADWLASTPVSVTIQNVKWIIPGVQSVHILSIALLIASTVTLDLRLVGVTRGGPSLAMLEKRFTPWFWGAIIVLLLTGLVMITGEPARELLNWMFYTKLVLVLAVVAVTFAVQVRLRARPADIAPTPAQRTADILLGGLSLVLIVAIIAAGRWIAYVVV